VLGIIFKIIFCVMAVAWYMGSNTSKKPLASIPKVEIVLKKEAVISS